MILVLALDIPRAPPSTQVHATTPRRVLNTYPGPAFPEVLMHVPWLDRIFREQGITLNNYTVDCIATGAISIWRDKFRSLPHCSLAGAAYLHPGLGKLQINIILVAAINDDF